MKNVTFKNLTEEQINAIKVLLGDACNIEKQVEEKKEETSFPQTGDKYYCIYSDGEIGENKYFSELNDDRNHLFIGNIFRTKEDAEFEVERLKVLKEMKKFAEPEDFEWNRNNFHCYIYYDYVYNRISFGNVKYHRDNNIYFKSEEDARACIEAVGEARIKKYYLKVNEPDREDNNV